MQHYAFKEKGCYDNGLPGGSVNRGICKCSQKTVRIPWDQCPRGPGSPSPPSRGRPRECPLVGYSTRERIQILKGKPGACHPSFLPSIYPSIHPSTHLAIFHQFFLPFIHPSAHPSFICPSTCPSMYPSIICPSIHPSAIPFIRLSVYPAFIYLSICASVLPLFPLFIHSCFFLFSIHPMLFKNAPYPRYNHLHMASQIPGLRTAGCRNAYPPDSSSRRGNACLQGQRLGQ